MSAPATKTNGWIALGIGEDIPARNGQTFDVRLRLNSEEALGFTWGKPEARRGEHGTLVVYKPSSEKEWNAGDHRWDVIAYRLHDPEDTAEQARRAERLERFNEIARRAPLDMPRPEPEPAPFRRREVINRSVGFTEGDDGLIHVSVCLARLWVAAAQDIRDGLSRRLAEDLTPAERADIHGHIRNMTALIDRHSRAGGAQ
ncbi:hypothetical protein [Asticcacaulis sp.]|uniref:hypothetical protein n=1 Tax=Asticcacaulis sp. TaxID=1872648 RepID=UPI003F7C5ACC